MDKLILFKSFTNSCSYMLLKGTKQKVERERLITKKHCCTTEIIYSLTILPGNFPQMFFNTFFCEVTAVIPNSESLLCTSQSLTGWGWSQGCTLSQCRRKHSWVSFSFWKKRKRKAWGRWLHVSHKPAHSREETQRAEDLQVSLTEVFFVWTIRKENSCFKNLYFPSRCTSYSWLFLST